MYYCSELDFNLLSLRVLKKKSFKIISMQRVFFIINNQKNTVLQAKDKNIIYPLL